MSRGNNRTLIPEARNGLSKFRDEVATELGVQLKEYNGDLTSREAGSIGGEMVKRMVQQYESNIK
ncbi:MAG: alpha/beta-type small acid-soluble spore protein [Clostridiaceae bacterium]